MTLFESQQQSQKQWKLKAHYRHLTIFDELLHNEFADARVRKERIDRRIKDMVNFSVAAVPFYQGAVQQRGVDIKSFATLDDLSQLPIITKADIQKNEGDFLARQLPQGIQMGGVASTSGSTGQPLKVKHSLNSFKFFSYLKQREYRMWNFDPAQTLASVRPASDLPRKQNMELINGEEVTRDSWMYVGNFFETGIFKGFNDTNPIEDIARWLENKSPCYLVSMAATLEHIALYYGQSSVRAKLLGALSISQQLTAGMRNLVESTLHTSVQQNYGLNEIGVVAVRCPESGYYHVHNEHCVIEIVNKKGELCQPGESGRLLVSGLNNYAMPLLRYDADDLATVPREGCPCGRSMQSFFDLRGRYRRTAHLPAGTWNYWDALLGCFARASAEEMATIEQYQLHQISEQVFHLKVKSPQGFSTSLREKVKTSWFNVNPLAIASLTIIELEQIPQQGKKFQNFISDLVPDEDH